MEIPKYFSQSKFNIAKSESTNEIEFENRNHSANKFVKGIFKADNDSVRIDIISSNYNSKYLKRKLKNQFQNEQIVNIRMMDYEFLEGNKILFDRDSIKYLPILIMGDYYEIAEGTCPLNFQDEYISCNETYPIEYNISVIYLGSEASECIDELGRVSNNNKIYEIFEFVRIV